MESLTNHDAERFLLSCCQLDDDREFGSIPKAINICEPDDFDDGRHRAVWMAVKALSARRDPIDFVTINEELRRLGRMEDVGGISYLMDTLGLSATSTRAVYYAKIVKDLSIRRAYRLAGKTIEVESGEIGNVTTEELEARARGLIDGIPLAETALPVQSGKDAVANAAASVQLLPASLAPFSRASTNSTRRSLDSNAANSSSSRGAQGWGSRRLRSTWSTSPPCEITGVAPSSHSKCGPSN